MSTVAGDALRPRLDRVQNAGEQVTLEPAKPVRARYVLVWLTSLPQSDSDRYRGSIAEISVRS